MTSVPWDDDGVKAIVASLVDKGFNEDALKQLSADQILAVIGPHHPVEAVNLVGSLKQVREQRSMLDLYSQYHKYVGRVSANFAEIKEESNASCILVGADGLTLTCLHVITRDGDLKGKRKASPPTIKVAFPYGFTRIRRDGTLVSTPIEFCAEIVHTDEDNDVALLLPSPPTHLKDLDFFYWWSVGNPLHTDTILLISYPNLLKEEYPMDQGTKAGEMPNSCIGFATYVNPSQVVASYTSLAGCSGGLVINVSEYGGHHGIGPHLGSMIDFKPLKEWGPKQLNLLNANLENKAHLGITARNVPSILHAFRTRMSMAKQMGPKATVTIKGTRRSKELWNSSKKRRKELEGEDEFSLLGRQHSPLGASKELEERAVDELPLFGPWPSPLGASKELEQRAVDELPLFGSWPGDDGYVTE